jgi:hypothetical protein
LFPSTSRPPRQHHYSFSCCRVTLVALAAAHCRRHSFRVQLLMMFNRRFAPSRNQRPRARDRVETTNTVHLSSQTCTATARGLPPRHFHQRSATRDTLIHFIQKNGTFINVSFQSTITCAE